MLSGLESLTPSERRVAEMAAENMTNKDIARSPERGTDWLGARCETRHLAMA